MKELPLIGYTEKLSARPGESIDFKVSSLSSSPYRASLHRSISADPNPKGPGIIEEDASNFFAQREFVSRRQGFNGGSYAISAGTFAEAVDEKIEVSVTVFPTAESKEGSVILELDSLTISLDENNRVIVDYGSESFKCRPLSLRNWWRLDLEINQEGKARLTQTRLGQRKEFTRQFMGKFTEKLKLFGPLSIGASVVEGGSRRHFNGKIEAPKLAIDGQVVGEWCFADDTGAARVPARVGPMLELVNFPTRAVTSSKWDATEMCWRHKPEHYAAIHFHEDDIYDFEWETDFSFKIPQDMPSGIYVMRIKSDMGEDAIPFFVCAPKGKPQAKLCVLVSTFTYTIYGNHARPDYGPDWQKRTDDWGAYPYNPADHPNYGLSTYNNHSDGSGICHASHRRPLFNMRPGYITFGDTPCSGLRHFPADSHLISWLHAKGIDYDIVTDWELHTEGVNAIKDYAAVTTGSHPEYHTTQTLDALRDYRDQGGHLNYLGGNGFYWRIAVHEENESLLEIRRAEDGIRAWAAEPGEYYNAFDGAYGGLWRRNARAPQDLVGIGFAAQGEFVGSPYQRLQVPEELSWVFKGIDDEILGDFGLSGSGAAGYELDHCNQKLGTPSNVVVLARSVTKDGAFMLVPEEQLTHLTNLVGAPEKDILHADMIYCDWPSGGTVFATGSITFCGCLPYNNYQNCISTLLENVFRHVIEPT